MPLKEIRPGLRTIHNGSNGVVKALVIVPMGGELTVPVEVADQLQRDAPAFKDGPTPQALLDLVAAAEARDEISESVAEPAPVVDEPKPAKRTAKKA